jgi:hypothetical protein
MSEDKFFKALNQLQNNIIESIKLELVGEIRSELNEFKNQYYMDRDYILSTLNTLDVEVLALKSKVNRMDDMIEKVILKDLKKIKSHLNIK